MFFVITRRKYGTQSKTRDVTTYWNNLKEAITTSCDETLVKAKRYHEDWFDENDDEIARITEENVLPSKPGKMILETRQRKQTTIKSDLQFNVMSES
jgi:hypothetical protein